VKDEGAYLNVMTSTLKFAVYCELLGLDKKIPKYLIWPCIFQSMPIWKVAP